MSDEWCVVDLETTGLYYRQYDRIIEVGLVAFDPEAGIRDEWHTLVNPQRDVGPSHIHGVTASMIAEAPAIGDVAGDILRFMSGRRLAAHNAPFERGFLASELGSFADGVDRLDLLCTMRQAARQGVGRKLESCCEVLGIENESAHTALSDARATAELLGYLIRSADVQVPEPASVASGLLPSGITLTREASTARRPQDSYLRRLVRRLPATPPVSEVELSVLLPYLELLDRSLEDRLVSDEEMESLAGLAVELGLTMPQIKGANLHYVAGLVAIAKADGVVTDAERADLDQVAALLDVDQRELSRLLESGTPADPSGIVATGAEFEGMNVCFTGSSICSLRGERLSRALSHQLASEAGLNVRKSVTKDLHLLVVTDPATQSGKARRAREQGVRIIAERSFWPKLGVMVD